MTNSTIVTYLFTINYNTSTHWVSGFLLMYQKKNFFVAIHLVNSTTQNN